MKILVTAAVLLLAGAAQAQTAPLQTPSRPVSVTPPAVSNLTGDLNSGPPAPAVYLAPVPTPATVTPPATVPAPPLRSNAPPVAAAAPQPRPAPVAAPASAPPVAVEAPAVIAPPLVPAAPAVTVLDEAARTALPFRADLPPGFEIVTGRPAPDFKIYTIRRGDRSFVMVYAGPASQFPIYSGQMVEAGGRASVVATEDGVRHAMEHLFQRSAAPREIHVWTTSLEGPDRALAEQIAQSVDVR